MKYKLTFLVLVVLAIVGLFINSCKKDNSGTVSSLFSGGHWQLASVIVTNTVGATTTLDTLNTTCDSTQIFTFVNNTCTYTNFDCIPQKSSGTWSLSADQLTLYATMNSQDTTAKKTSMPFANAQIVNLGLYSLVLQTGDYNIVPTTTNSTRVVRYGFVRQKTAGQ